MKKILCAIALVAISTGATAQDKIVRKARTLKEEVQNLVAQQDKKEKEVIEMQTKLQQCIDMIEPTLTSPETKKELGNAWDIKAQLYKYKFSPLLDNVINKQPTDTAALAEYIYTSLDAMEQCFKAEQATGKELVYSKLNKIDVMRFRPYIAYCGQMFFQNGQHAKAADAFRRWLNYPQTYTILEGEESAEETAQRPQIAYYTCLAAYFSKDYKTLAEFMPQAKKYTDEKDQVNQLWLTSLIEKGDTTAWLAAGKEIVLEDPAANDGVAQNILAYYFNKDNAAEALKFTEELLASDPNSRLGNYAMGLVRMNAHKYQEAITFFDKAIEADPTFSDAYYNAGVCYSNIGYDINEAISGKKLTQAQNNAEIAKVKAEYAKSEPYFLKVQELEPENTMKWATRLRTVYFIIGNKAKEKEMSVIIGD